MWSKEELREDNMSPPSLCVSLEDSFLFLAPSVRRADGPRTFKLTCVLELVLGVEAGHRPACGAGEDGQAAGRPPAVVVGAGSCLSESDWNIALEGSTPGAAVQPRTS